MTNAYLISIAIVAANNNVNDMEEAAYETLARIPILSQYADERKADLYARIAETVQAGMGFKNLVTAVEEALIGNAREFYYT